MTRTIENCSLITAREKKGKEPPTRFWHLNRCMGVLNKDGTTYAKCKKCKYCIVWEGY